MKVPAVKILLLAIMSITVLAQNPAGNAGIQIGTPRPQQNPASALPVSPNPVQGMTSPPIQGMTTPPILPAGGGIVRPQSGPLVTQPLGTRPIDPIFVLPFGMTVFVPTGTLVVESNSSLEPGAFLTSPAARGSTTSIERPSRTAAPATTPADVTRLELGTPRDKVIAKYGNPVAYIMNMNGETLYFSDGVVVFLKNGVIAAPGKQDIPTRP